MDLKLVFLSICVWAFAITYSEAGIPKCCMSTRDHIPRKILIRVQRWEIQNSNGACDISALVLHVKNFQKPICAKLKVMNGLSQIQKRRKRRHHKEVH